MKSRNIKVILCVLLVACLLIPTFSLSAFAVENATASTTVDSGVSIESGKVYYIKNQKSNLYLDVYGEYTADGSIVKHDYFNGGLNQQFMVVRVSGDVYEIIPMHAQDKRLDITGGSTENDTQVQIYTSNSSASQRFKIIDDGNGTGSFKILTGNTDYVKCITNQYASASPSNVVQYGYGNEGTADNDHWYFEKVDKIGVNLEKNVNIGRNSFNEFTLDFSAEYIFQNVTYVLETVGSSDTMLELYFNGEYMFGNDDSGEGLNARLVFTPNNVNGITVKVKMYGTQCGNAKLRLRPQEQIYANSYNGDINTMEDVYDVYEHFNKLDLYVNHHVNTNPLGNGVFTNNPAINNRYYFMTAHGSRGSVTYAPGARFTTADLPIMTNVEFVVWAVCFGAAAPTGGVSMVTQSINNGAQNALGWPGKTWTNTSRTFTTHLWEDICNGVSVSEAVTNATNHTRNTYWYKAISGWGEDTILSPVLETATAKSGISVTTFESLGNNTVVNEIILLSSDAYLNDVNNYARYDSSDGKIIFARKVNGILTNNVTVIERADTRSGYVKAELNTGNFAFANKINLDDYRTEGAVVENFFYILISGEYHIVRRTQTTDGSSITESYYDITTGMHLTEDFVIEAFNYGG